MNLIEASVVLFYATTWAAPASKLRAALLFSTGAESCLSKVFIVRTVTIS